MKASRGGTDARSLAGRLKRDGSFVLPRRPLFLPEASLFPYRDGILVTGGASDQFFRGRASQLVPELARLMDGTRTIGDVSVASGLPAANVEEVAYLFFAKGLIEDGEWPSREQSPWLSFLGRNIDRSRISRNRWDALDQVRNANVRVAAAPADRARVERCLGEAGCTRHDPLAPPDLTVIVESPEYVAEAADFGVSSPLLYAWLGGSAVSIGPLCIAPGSICYACYAKFFRPREAEPLGEPARSFWLAALGSNVLSHLGTCSTTHLVNRMQIVRLDRSFSAQRVLVASNPSCEVCGCGRSAITPIGPGYDVWAFHVATTMPPALVFPPRAYQEHFEAKNISLAAKAQTGISGTMKIALGQWAYDDARATIARALALACGYERDGPLARRINASGGGLGSPELFVLAPSDSDFELLRYRGAQDELEVIAKVPKSRIARMQLLQEDELDASYLIIGTSRLEKTLSKYRSFAYRLAYLDAGFCLGALSLSLACSALEVSVCLEIDEFWLRGLVDAALDEGYGVTTFAMKIANRTRPKLVTEQRFPSLSVAAKFYPAWAGPLRPCFRDFEALMLKRSSARDFTGNPVPLERVREILSVVAEGLRFFTRLAPRTEGIVEPIAIVRSGAGHPFEVMGVREQRARQLDAGFGLHRILQQSNLWGSAGALLFLADMELTIGRNGFEGYKEALISAGFTALVASLGCNERSIGACPSGGFFAEGVAAIVPDSYFRSCPVFAVAFGLNERWSGVASGR